MSEPNTVKINFTYKESPNYRVVHMDGAFGGVSPLGQLRVGIYNERSHYPKSSTVTVRTGDNRLLSEEYDVPDGFIRQVEIDLVMDLQAAVNFSVWMSRKVKEMAAALGVPEQEINSMLATAEGRTSE